MGVENTSDVRKFKLTALEVCILIGSVVLIVGLIFNLNINTDNEPVSRLKKMTDAELWGVIESETFNEALKLKAFNQLTQISTQRETLVKSYELLNNSKVVESEVRLKIEENLVGNPSEVLADRITYDFINLKIDEKLWDKLKKSWAKTLLPRAFENSQFLFKDLNTKEKRRFEFVVEVLILDNNAYIFDVFEKYLSANPDYRGSGMDDILAEGLVNLGLNHADDVLRIILMIMSNNEKTDDFNAFSGKIVNVAKKFAHTKEIRQRLQRELAKVDASKWNTVRDTLSSWLKSRDK